MNYGVEMELKDLFNSVPKKSFVIFAKDRKKLEGFNDYETFKQKVSAAYLKSSPELAKSYILAVGERPKATTQGELFSDKKAARAAKTGLANSDLIPTREKIHFVFVTNDSKWEVAKDKYTGAILYKHATYYAVGERRPEKVNGVTTKYFILPTHAKCDYLGNGQYGEPSYVKVITGSTDITEEEFKNYKMSAVE